MDLEKAKDFVELDISGMMLDKLSQPDSLTYTNLRTIHADENRLNIDEFSFFPVLRHLSLANNSIYSLNPIPKQFPKLLSLNLSYNLFMNDTSSLKVLNNLPFLQRLDISYCGISDLSPLACPSLTHLTIDGNPRNYCNILDPSFKGSTHTKQPKSPKIRRRLEHQCMQMMVHCGDGRKFPRLSYLSFKSSFLSCLFPSSLFIYSKQDKAIKPLSRAVEPVSKPLHEDKSPSSDVSSPSSSPEKEGEERESGTLRSSISSQYNPLFPRSRGIFGVESTRDRLSGPSNHTFSKTTFPHSSTNVTTTSSSLLFPSLLTLDLSGSFLTHVIPPRTPSSLLPFSLHLFPVLNSLTITHTPISLVLASRSTSASFLPSSIALSSSSPLVSLPHLTQILAHLRAEKRRGST
ncbi:hypothetical protein ADUPG1_007107, partial [Aduncisulcus paluster]